MSLPQNVVIDSSDEELDNDGSSPEYQPQNLQYTGNEWNINTGAEVDEQMNEPEREVLYEQLKPQTDIAECLDTAFYRNVSMQVEAESLEGIQSRLVVVSQKPIDKCNESTTASWTQSTLRIRLKQDEVPSTSKAVPQTRFHCMDCDLLIDIKNIEPFKQHSHLKNCRLGKEFSCDFCTKSFNKLQNKRVHVSQHTVNEQQPVDGKFLCPICPKKFSRRATFQSHHKVHIENDNYRCSDCGLEFEFKAFFNRHVRLSQCAPESDQPDDRLFCARCSTLVPTSTVAKHIKHHNVVRKLEMKSNKKAPPMVPDLKRPHRCEVCDHRFRRPAELKRHHATHSSQPLKNNISKTDRTVIVNKISNHDSGCASRSRRKTSASV